MADEMDESVGKEERDASPEDQSAQSTNAAPDSEGATEVSVAPDTDDAPVVASRSAEVSDSAGESQVSDTPIHAASSEVPQSEATPPTPRSTASAAFEGSATPAGRGEPSKAGTSPASSNPADSSQSSFGGLDKAGLDLLYDVELDATLQFGSKEMLLRDVLELGPGDVVELDRHIAEPVDLVVGDRIVARGEVVVASGNFALRVTEVATPQMRLESIRCLF